MPVSQNRIVLVDVDTQFDFMLPQGNLYVPGAEKIIPNLKRLMKFALDHGVTVVSTVDAHTPNDPEFLRFPPHCVQGTPGQAKIPQTLLPQRKVLPNAPQALPSPGQIARCQQWILEKQTFDVFTNVNAAPFFERLGSDRYIVFGVATEYCVRTDTLGLLRLGRPVDLVVDAIQGIDPHASQAALRELQQAGVRLVKTREIVAAAVPA